MQAGGRPEGVSCESIPKFLTQQLKALSLKAALGFRRRALESTQVHSPKSFMASLERFFPPPP